RVQRDEGSDDGQLVAAEPWDGLETASSRAVLWSGPTSAVRDVATRPTGRCEDLAQTPAGGVGRHSGGGQRVSQATQIGDRAAEAGSHPPVGTATAVGLDLGTRTGEPS